MPEPTTNPERFSPQWVEDLVSNHQADVDQIRKMNLVRDAAAELIQEIVYVCPNCADRTAAIRKVREALMTANASIALRGRV